MFSMSTTHTKRASLQPSLFLKEWRKKKGLTQDQIAEMMGTTKATVSRYETLERDPGVDGIFKYASALGVGPSFLFRHPDTISLDDMLTGASDIVRVQAKAIVAALIDPSNAN